MSEVSRPQTIGILLLQLGGPERQEAVAPFLRNLFSDPDIIPVPGGPRAQKALAWLIGTVRGRKVRGYYRLIGGGSPIRRLTELQAANLEAELDRRAGERRANGPNLRTAVAMRYWHPLTEEALDSVEGADALIALTLFPQYSIATTGSSLKELDAVRAERRDTRPLEIIRQWYDAPDYLDALAARIRQAVEKLTPAGRAEGLILWSAHGLPQKIVDTGDPYVEQIKATVAGTMNRLDDLGLPHRLAYQSRTGPLTWTGPGTEDVLVEEAASGRKAVVVVPVSFVSDHIETLYEIDLLYGDEAKRLGIREYVRVESFNGGSDLTGVLARLVEERLVEKGWMTAGGVA